MSRFVQEIRFAPSTGGASIAYATSGRGWPLVRAGHWMTHLEWDWQMPVWGPWIEALSTRYRLIRYDNRGCGLSSAATEPVLLETLVTDLAAVIDAAGHERVALLGASQGGAAAIAYAAANPHRVSHLVLCDAFARGALVRQPGQRPMIDALARLVEDGWGQDNAAFRQVFTTQFFPGASQEQAKAFNDMQRLSCSPAQAARIVSGFAEIDASPHLAALRCPTLVMHCRGDARIPFEEGRFLAANIAGARFEILDSINHVPLAGEPAFDRMMALIDGFLPGSAGGAGEPAFAGLSARERDLLELLAQGLDNAQIAARLGLAEKTVRNNVSALFTRLEVENRAQAIVRARQAGFGIG
ncbi:alpha/beta fold hydrolase [Ramlibacter henchirensis]|uniref:Alpha/beta fold hydrolase n=1 Tax=Ramlibacter henchirensis TaxID=204072 RepID=A0A4Z0C425_9BURK|nr:alpha/beta fold hydrolase [Ramlibacter henchirensis]TFZ05220.1 alpha/beta fold hydrolase [Ramlibacter henchirensis]